MTDETEVPPAQTHRPDSCGAAEGPGCHSHGSGPDWLLLISSTIVIMGYFAYLLLAKSLEEHSAIGHFSEAVFTLVNTIWWGVLLGMIMVGLLASVPREFVLALLGQGGTFKGLIRAVFAGVFLDLCSHGILMVGVKLYERGASIGQVVAFLLASPWNSLSLTLILIALIGLKWTLVFIVLSMAIGLLTGAFFDRLSAKGVLPANPNRIDLPEGFDFFGSMKSQLRSAKFDRAWFIRSAKSAYFDSKPVLRWLFFGLVLASAIRAFVDGDTFSTYFGPTLMGLVLTMIAATLIEVCSEGSTPIAADLLTRAGAPGNSFGFLMTGVATDYTEVMVLKDTTRSWRIALFLPLLSVPQVLVVAVILNQFSG